MSFAEADAPPVRETNLVGACPEIVEIRRKILHYAALDGPVVISGESGTGKSLVAHALHQASGARSLHVLQCRELKGEAESWLMDALRLTPRVRCSCGRPPAGTNVLVEDLEEALGESNRSAGSILPRLAQLADEAGPGFESPRLIVTTRYPLDAKTEPEAPGEVRWIRGRGLRLHLPPLRRRGCDIALIARCELARLASESGRTPPSLEPAALRLLHQHPWPENLRELLFVVRHLMAAQPDAEAFDRFDVREALDALRTDFLPRARFEERERGLLQAALDENAWNVSETARRLGRSRGWLRRRMAALELG